MMDNKDIENLDQLKSVAYEFLGKNNFSKAVEMYRKAISQNDFSKEVLINLSVSEAEERLAFAREVSKSDGWNSKFYEAQVAVEIRRYGYAIKICSSILKSFKLEINDQIQVRILRLKSACLCGDKNILIEDFMTIWEFGNIGRPFKLLRKTILKDIAKIQDPDMHSALIMLAKQNGLPFETIDFINNKAKELESLNKSIESIVGTSEWKKSGTSINK